jgi:hypothetical protein
MSIFCLISRISLIIPKIILFIFFLIFIFNIFHIYNKGFARGFPCSILLVFSQSYVEHDLRKNKIVIPFFYQPINFYELIVRF